jgi:hypothetical protein
MEFCPKCGARQEAASQPVPSAASVSRVEAELAIRRLHDEIEVTRATEKQTVDSLMNASKGAGFGVIAGLVLSSFFLLFSIVGILGGLTAEDYTAGTFCCVGTTFIFSMYAGGFFLKKYLNAGKEKEKAVVMIQEAHDQADAQIKAIEAKIEELKGALR